MYSQYFIFWGELNGIEAVAKPNKISDSRIRDESYDSHSYNNIFCWFFLRKKLKLKLKLLLHILYRICFCFIFPSFCFYPNRFVSFFFLYFSLHFNQCQWTWRLFSAYTITPLGELRWVKHLRVLSTEKTELWLISCRSIPRVSRSCLIPIGVGTMRKGKARNSPYLQLVAILFLDKGWKGEVDTD